MAYHRRRHKWQSHFENRHNFRSNFSNKKRYKGTSYQPQRRNYPKLNIKIFDLIKTLFALFTMFILIVSIYLTFTTFLVGLFIPPIICIAIAGSIIRFFNRGANGKKFYYDTLALAGVFLLLGVLMLYRIFAPIFGMFR